MVALSRNVGRKQAFEMLATGRFLTATEAVEAGLVNRSVHEDRLEEEVRVLAETVAGKLGAAVRIGKRAFYRAGRNRAGRRLCLHRRGDGREHDGRGTAEGIAAFLEKRTPSWSD